MSATMHESTTSGLYDLWSKFYDYTFGALVIRRQQRACAELHVKAGDRVLDLGVGTGMTLKYYPHDVTVVGLDLSHGMILKAARKATELQHPEVHLVVGDALLPPFAPRSFDHVLITHVISVVSEPEKLLQWAEKLVKPGGRVVICNHFESSNRIVRFFERILNPIFVKIGWKSDLRLNDVLSASTLHLEYHFKLGYMDLWQIIVLSEASAADAPEVVIPKSAVMASMKTRPAVST